MIRQRFHSISYSIFIGIRSTQRKQTDSSPTSGQVIEAAIFYGNEEEKRVAEASKEKLGKSGKFDKPIVTEILPAMKFYPAEDYHQKYYRTNKEAFEAFEEGSGRNRFHKKNSARFGSRRNS